MTLTEKRLLQEVNLRAIDPETAERWLKDYEYVGQRKYRPWAADKMAAEMQRGAWVPGEQMRIAYWRGKGYLLNGQHRLHAIITSGTTQTFSVLEEYVDDKEDLARIYGVIDVGIRRTPADILAATGLAEELGLPNVWMNRLATAINYLESGCVQAKGASSTLLRDDLIACLRLYTPYLHTYIDWTTGKFEGLKSPVGRASTLSIGLLTIRYSRPHEVPDGPTVEDFWKGVLFDDGVARADPRKHANRHLLTTSIGGTGTPRGGKVQTNAGYSSRFLAVCFNAWMDSRTLQLVKVLDQTGPLNLWKVPKDPAAWLKP